MATFKGIIHNCMMHCYEIWPHFFMHNTKEHVTHIANNVAGKHVTSRFLDQQVSYKNHLFSQLVAMFTITK